ncbi:sorting nexin-25-like isoform X1 [Lytechinus variegatus]|uniref:sorting nexin-25-like isoform X1 n=1 Tax=Lytechinus variegatus TaxID=7654 RepID=UPI001BB200AC|nr:sorting nexin-25-like isoform X1 [Lytechinus variegatus]
MIFIGKIINMYSIAGFGLFLAVSCRLGLVSSSSPWLYLGLGLVGFLLGFSLVLFSGKIKKPAITHQPPPAFQALVTKIMEIKARRRRPGRRVVISRNIDNAIRELFHLAVRDYVMIWYKTLGKEGPTFTDALETDMWEVVHNLSLRLKRIDMVRFLSSDVVYKLCDHFQKLRETSVREGEEPKIFYLHPSLASEEAETQFFREAVEVLLVLLLPERLAGCETARQLLREIFTCQVVKPAVDMLCSPHFINTTFLMHLQRTEKLVEKSKRRYAYAATYEEFIKLINSTSDVDELLQIRYHILTEIMHATVIEDLKKTRGELEGEKGRARGTKKGDMLRGRNLKRYINQCNVAKAQCEKRLKLLGGPDYQSYYKGSGSGGQEDAYQTQRLMSLDEILGEGKKRECFLGFLKQEGKEDLLNFWQAVESLKSSKKPRDQHMNATTVYRTFVATSSVVKVERQLIRGMEAFLVGNAGPDAFYDAQHKIYQLLDQEHYPSFLVSENYVKLCDELAPKSGSEDFSSSVRDELESSFREDSSNQALPSSESLVDQRNTVESTLQRIEEKLSNKTQALSNLKSSHGVESKMEQLLENEIENLKLQKKRVELYIQQTDLWTEHIDKWRIDVCLPDIQDISDGKSEIYFLMVVHPTDPRIPTSGWVVSRRLTEFYNLQNKLKECSHWLAKVKLPQSNKKLFNRETMKEFLERSRSELQKHLAAILGDATLRHSEALYSFLIPKPNILVDTPVQEVKKGGFSLASIFKNSPTEDDRSNLGDSDAEEETAQDRKDSIAEPLYSLISEIFELHGMFRWLRRTLIVFVQATFGRTINKQLRDTVDWLTSESMILFYLRYFQDSMWPDGVLAPPQQPPSLEEQRATQKEAREKFLQNLPDFLQNLLGKHNSRLGAIKIFEALQDTRTTKHIFYNLLELALLEICPELKDPRLLEQLEEDGSQKDPAGAAQGHPHGARSHSTGEDLPGEGRLPAGSEGMGGVPAGAQKETDGAGRVQGEGDGGEQVVRQRRGTVEGKEKSDEED